MSSWTDDKAPLLPPSAQDFLKRRGAEVTGLVFLALGAAFAVMLFTFNPADPSWFNATPDAPQNMLGAAGAFLADPMMRMIGLAAFGVPLALVVWAVRLLVHRGDERIWSRIVFSPVAIIFAAVFAAAHAPMASWELATGLGGMAGDSLLGIVFDAIPAAAETIFRPVTLALAVVTLALALFSLGVNWPELRYSVRFLVRSLVRVLVVVSMATATVLSGMWAFAANALAKPRSEKVAPPRPLGMGRVEPAFDEDDEAMEGPRRRIVIDDDDAEDGDEIDDEPLVRRSHSDDDDADDVPAPARMGGAVLPSILRRAAGMTDASDRDEEDDEPPMMRTGPERPPVERPVAKPLKKSRKAIAEENPTLALDDADTDGEFILPPLNLLQSPKTIVRHTASDTALEENARMLESVLDDYGVRGEIGAVRPGPVVTMYELEPAPGLKASRVIGLADDIARSMSALAARVSTIPGRNVIGIELPNANREVVLLREQLSSKVYGDSAHRLALALGKDIGGEPVVANLAKMPHLLIAGTTGSGKSVAVNTMILSLLYRLTPKECKLIMIDPKMLELSVYDGIPHLLSPVVTDPKKAVVALKWAVAEMEDRYKKMSKMGVRNLDGYNARVRDALEKGEAFSRTVQTGFDDETGQPIIETEEITPEELPFIVVIVDEMADLMMVAGKEIEACIQRLAQMARASGIHIIMATQRPSVDVITGTIKANFPTRISFQVTSKVDSRTILSEQGAEQLLGMGDMLYMAGGGRITRVHGPFVSDEEVEEVVRHLKSQGEPNYVGAVTEGDDDAENAAAIDEILGLGGDGGENELYDQAVMIIARDRKCSTSYIQRKLSIGYNKAARIVEQMEDQGVVSPANHVGKREVLIEER
ncbi:MAG: DNA translocase FtsK [Pikeienuella sp.]